MIQIHVSIHFLFFWGQNWKIIFPLVFHQSHSLFFMCCWLLRRGFYQANIPCSLTNFVHQAHVDWAVLFVLCYIWFLGWPLQLKDRKNISFTHAVATQQTRPVIQSSCVGHNTTCQVKACILGESLPVWCFHHCLQQGDQTEEWAADSWREKGSWNLLLWFFTGRIRKKRQHLLANSYIKCSLQELHMKRSWKDFDCSCRKETKKS